MLNAEKCWEALGRRDRSLDGSFFFGVVTTGVYCRPSCPARRPLRRNVRFYSTPADAERDGLRPCLRCHPLAAFSALTDAKILELCAYIEEHSDERILLADLAARAGLSRFHLQRSFKAVVGLTPKEYLETCRLRKFKQSLREGENVTDAVYDVGFGSSSRAYEQAGARMGMTPNQYRQGARGLAITYAEIDSPAGRMLMAATDRGICFVQFGDSVEELTEALHKEYPAAEIRAMSEPDAPEFRDWVRAITNHLAGALPRLELPLDVRATAFQASVWQYLQRIPYGEVRSYQQVAVGIGRPTASRAVAQACASNKLAVVIPCHRVIRGSGDLGGYKWGIARKRTLLGMEGKEAARPEPQP